MLASVGIDTITELAEKVQPLREIGLKQEEAVRRQESNSRCDSLGLDEAAAVQDSPTVTHTPLDCAVQAMTLQAPRATHYIFQAQSL
jgi:hypothetical protein